MSVDPRVRHLVIVSALALITAGSALSAQAARPISYTHYPFEGGAPFGVIDVFLAWTNAPAEGAVFAATQFFFERGQGGYMGLQVSGSSRKAIFSIWDIEPGSATPGFGCDRFGGEGEGARCLTDYPWVEGREYRLRVRHCGDDPAGELWCGSLLDTTSGMETQIGSIHLATNGRLAGYGRLTRYVATFLEYFAGPDTCDGHPFSETLWRGPYGDGSVLARSADPDYTTCPNSEVSSTGRPYVRHQNAGDIVRWTPAAAPLWACSDGLDDDGDGRIDFPDDAGCSRPGDFSEVLDCSDGLDNDGDGLVDFPEDAGCDSEESATEGSDRDRDGILDDRDNCVAESNSDQRDTNADGYGNACDADFDGDEVVGLADFNRFRVHFGLSESDLSFDADVDLDGDGSTGLGDFNTMRSRFGRPPGPSAVRPR